MMELRLNFTGYHDRVSVPFLVYAEWLIIDEQHGLRYGIGEFGVSGLSPFAVDDLDGTITVEPIEAEPTQEDPRDQQIADLKKQLLEKTQLLIERTKLLAACEEREANMLRLARAWRL